MPKGGRLAPLRVDPEQDLSVCPYFSMTIFWVSVWPGAFRR